LIKQFSVIVNIPNSINALGWMRSRNGKRLDIATPRRGGDAGAQSGRLQMGDRIRPPFNYGTAAVTESSQDLIAAGNRLYVGADGRLYAFAF
jgi:hypothetical protein